MPACRRKLVPFKQCSSRTSAEPYSAYLHRCHDHADADADGDADADTDANADINALADFDANTDPHFDSDAYADTNADRFCAVQASIDRSCGGADRSRPQLDDGPRRSQIRALDSMGPRYRLATT